MLQRLFCFNWRSGVLEVVLYELNIFYYLN